MIGLKAGTVALFEHKMSWKTEARRTMARLKRILGPAIRDIQHVGSTAVPSIKAKPIIDLAAAADDLDAVLAFEQALADEGFHHIPEAQIEGGQVLLACGSFYDGTGDLQTHFIHVVPAGSTAWFNYIQFRDYLNGKPSAARAYEALKVSLARRAPVDSGREKYLRGKQDFIVSALREALFQSYLGQTVDLIIEQPGRCLQPGNRPQPGACSPAHPAPAGAPVRAGHVPYERTDGGGQLPACLLGVREPADRFTGTVIAIARRADGSAERLVAAPPGTLLTQNEIAEQIGFLTPGDRPAVEALEQKSCGAVVFRPSPDGIRILCLRQRWSRAYSVPKGHMEAFETEVQTARREIWEETGISADLMPDFRTTVAYDIPGGKHKTVVLFLAAYRGPLKIDGREIVRADWLPPEAAKSTLPAWYTPVLEQVEQYLAHGRFAAR